MPTSSRSAVNEAALRLSTDIGETLADRVGLIALARYFDGLHAQLAKGQNDKTNSKPIFRSKVKVATSAEAIARLAAEVPSSELTRAHKAVEIGLCQELLDLGISTAPAVRIARIVREQAALVIVSA